MEVPQKKQRLDHAASAGNDYVVTFDDLGVDELANIFAFLPVMKEVGFLALKDIMSKRRINKKSREVVKKTIVPLTDFRVGSMIRYNAMTVMARAMPNLQRITLCNLRNRHKWSDGEDPDETELAAITANYTSHDIEIISNFSKLRILEIYGGLNGRYPFLFNSFPLLQKLDVSQCEYLKFDLEMLAGFPVLKELDCYCNRCVTGNISSLRLLKDTLEKVSIFRSDNVQGNFMDLADFPRLKELDLQFTAVTGDIRDIGESDFSSLEIFDLPYGVYGGRFYQLQSISDGADLVRAVYPLKKHHPLLNMKCPLQDLSWTLMEDSPDWYTGEDVNGDDPPFYIAFVKAGSRLGYRWKTDQHNPCEVNWLDPEPDRESSDYGKYIEELQEIERDVSTYSGFHQPPTEEQYYELVDQR